MAAEQIRYRCTALVGTNKKGVLKPIDGGYYRMTVGGFNIHNANGVYYALGNVQKLFESPNSDFRRRIKAGCLKGENGHPNRGSMSKSEFFSRLNRIDEGNIAVHFRDLYLDYDNYKSESGFPQVGVIAELTPSGTHGPALQKSLDNPHEEVCFSVRSACEEVEEAGKIVRYTLDVVTYDWVVEGGVGIARKYYSMGLEDINGDLIVTPAVMEVALENAKMLSGLESAEVHKLMSLQENVGWAKPKGSSFFLPPSAGWGSK